MKKKFAIVIMSILVLTGCGKDIPDKETESTSITAFKLSEDVEKIVIPDGLDINFNSINLAKSDPYITALIEGQEMTAGELWFMSADTFEKWCMEYYPDVASDLGISWENLNWDNVRVLLYKVVFGSGIPDWAKDETVAAAFKGDSDSVDTALTAEEDAFNEYAPDFTDDTVIYLAPPKGYVESMSKDKKIDWVKKVVFYLYASDEEIMEELDKVSEQELLELADDLVETLSIDYPHYTYTPGDETRPRETIQND